MMIEKVSPVRPAIDEIAKLLCIRGVVPIFGTSGDDLDEAVREAARAFAPAVIAICSFVPDSPVTPARVPRRVAQTDVIPVTVRHSLIGDGSAVRDAVIEALVPHFPGRRSLRMGVNVIGSVSGAERSAIDATLRRIGTYVNASLPASSWAEYASIPCGAVNAVFEPSYARSVERLRVERGLPSIAGLPAGIEGTYRWITRIGEALGLNRAQTQLVAVEERAMVRAEVEHCRLDDVRLCVMGDDGREFALARLLIDAGAAVPRLVTTLARSALTIEEDRRLREAGCTVDYAPASAPVARGTDGPRVDWAAASAGARSLLLAQGIAAVDLSACVLCGARGAKSVLNAVAGSGRGANRTVPREAAADADAARSAAAFCSRPPSDRSAPASPAGTR